MEARNERVIFLQSVEIAKAFWNQGIQEHLENGDHERAKLWAKFLESEIQKLEKEFNQKRAR